MAKRSDDAVNVTVGSFFGLDQAQPKATRPGRRGVSVAVHMDVEIRDAYQALADAHEGLSRNAAMRYALGWFLREYRAGRAAFEFTETRKLEIPR